VTLLHVSVLLLSGVGLEFGQSGVDPELRAGLHRVVFVVLSTGLRQWREVKRVKKRKRLVLYYIKVKQQSAE